MSATVELPLPQIEAMILFIAHRQELWNRYCKDFNINPMELPELLTKAHGRAVLYKIVQNMPVKEEK